MLKAELRQNFTISPDVLDDVYSSLKLEKDDFVVEVGAGKGVLSQKILTAFKGAPKHKNHPNLPHLLSYEVDSDLREDLDSIKYRNSGQFDYRIQNFLQAKPKPGFNKATGNIPYHISEPLLFKLIEWDFEKIVFVTGIKFANKVTGIIPGKIATVSKYLYDSKIEKTYDKTIFYPRSKANSALLVMEKKVNFENDTDKKLAEIMRNIHRKHLWLNKYLGFEQSQKGQIYHMDLDKLVAEVKNK